MSTTAGNQTPQPAWIEPDEQVLVLAWKQFNESFSTEEVCITEIYRRASADGLLQCRYCGNRDLGECSGTRKQQCPSCRKIIWTTAGTFFDHAKLVRPIMAAIWLTEHGVILNAQKLHRLLGIAQSSAWAIIKKIMTVIQSHIEEEATPVHSANFAASFCKRSRETPAKAPPIAEEEELRRKLSDAQPPGEADKTKHLGAQVIDLSCLEDRLSCKHESPGNPALQEQSVPGECGGTVSSCGGGDEPADDLAAEERRVAELLSEVPLHFDVLADRAGLSTGDLSATLMMLELGGVVARLPGDWYVRRILQPIGQTGKHAPETDILSEAAACAISSFLVFVRNQFLGISRKYLQTYLAAHWCGIARDRWRCWDIFAACLHFGAVTYRQIREYISPATVLIDLSK